MSLQPKDLFGFIADLYIKKCTHDKVNATLFGYLEFARAYLMTNQPTQLRYLASGLGVLLREGQLLAFTLDQVGSQVMQDESISIIRAAQNPLQSSFSAPAMRDEGISLNEALSFSSSGPEDGPPAVLEADDAPTDTTATISFEAPKPKRRRKKR